MVAPLPDDVRTALHDRLATGETIVAWARLDLDSGLRFAEGVLVLTSLRLLARQADEWREWRLSPDLVLVSRDHAGVATLELCDGTQRLQAWHHTLASARSMGRLAEQFSKLTAGQAPLAELESYPQEAGAASAKPQTPPAWALLRLWRFARPYRVQLFVGFALTVLATAATLVPPYLTMPLMDEVLIPFQNGVPIDYGKATGYLVGLLAAAVLAWVLGWAHTYLLARVSERIGADLRNTAYSHLQHLSLEYFGGKRTGDLISRVGAETDRICLFLSLHLLEFASNVLMITMTAGILFYIDPWLALATLVPLPFIAWMIQSVRDKLRFGFEKADRVWSEITSVLADTIPGIRVVKAFAQEQREIGRFREANRRNLVINDRVNRVWALFSPSVTLATEVGLLVVWVFGIWLIAGHQISVGVLAAFLSYIGRFYLRLDSMSRFVSVMQKAAAGAKRIFDILDRVSSVPQASNPVQPGRIQGRIEIRRAGFRYGNRQVIQGLNLDIEPGEMIGLVGHSGSGKSTLLNLICRFYDVSQGSIKVDGTDLRRLDIEAYRRNIGVVLQEPFLFFGTIAENIAYGKPDASRAQIVAAARAAHAHEFILRLPQGYDSLVGERGQALSGGERQRISIARALLIDPRILILDEATSSVDTATEKEIQKALDNLVRGRTTIAVAHRLSTLRKADRLVVLERGKVIEQGSHDALIAAQGAYFRLHQAQARGETETPSSEEETWSEEDET
ncbi:MAG TPA: ABC transporter ATP-binding protein [Pusillimonas sp.]|uniref:cyanophycin metabolism-associated ABC transporter n=1 Tax=Pusillimonas sp. TaxID=3040095 RepID=UPI002C3308B1|nr:ABC transporter ATP-binding protein [Pusillimonas sp.]HUH88882.1 ABC transporter ATP-binding protein [Pusillimonas sp.]